MSQVTILYFGRLREDAGTHQEEVSTAASTIADLIRERAQTLDFPYKIQSLRFARNEALCPADESIHDGDTIAFMPPMAGG